MKTYFTGLKEAGQILDRMSIDGDLFAPVSGANYEKVPREAVGKVKNNAVRLPDSAKLLLFPVKEKVSSYFGSGQKGLHVTQGAVFGIKNCDLASLRVLDELFLKGDFEDPFYAERRKALTVISGDCFSPLKTCFCTQVGLNPYPDDGFDLNISPISNGFLLDVATAKGEKIISGLKDHLREASREELAERGETRKKVIREVNDVNKDFSTSKPYAELVKENFNSGAWMDQAKTCVACNACNLACPTCYCFLLMDEKAKGSVDRNRGWDSCIYDRYARVAGGANPRKRVYERFRHHYLHKFDYFPKSTGILACTGCGRCIEACLGKIDKRETIKKLERSA